MVLFRGYPMRFSKAVYLRVVNLFFFATTLCVVVWIYILDPQPLTLSIVALSAIIVALLSIILIATVRLFPDPIEKLLRVIREWKSGWQQRWIKENIRQTDSPSKKP